MPVEELLKDFQPLEDRTDRMMLFMLTGSNMNNVMKDWMPPPPTAAPPKSSDESEDPIIQVKAKKTMKKQTIDDTI